LWSRNFLGKFLPPIHQYFYQNSKHASWKIYFLCSNERSKKGDSYWRLATSPTATSAY
jgi:hypothetical protein